MLLPGFSIGSSEASRSSLPPDPKAVDDGSPSTILDAKDSPIVPKLVSNSWSSSRFRVDDTAVQYRSGTRRSRAPFPYQLRRGIGRSSRQKLQDIREIIRKARGKDDIIRRSMHVLWTRPTDGWEGDPTHGRSHPSKVACHHHHDA